MTDDGKRVVKGFAKLSRSDKKEVYEEIKQYMDGSVTLQERIDKRWSIDAGPIGGRCPCCGR